MTPVAVSGMSGKESRRVMIIFESTPGAARHYLAAGHCLQQQGFSISMVGPPEGQSMAQHFGLAYISNGPAISEILAKPSVIAATTANSLSKFEAALATEMEPFEAASIHNLCSAVKGFDPQLLLSSLRNFHRVTAIGNALNIPLLPLALQEPNKSFGDCLEPAWAQKKDGDLAAFLAKELRRLSPIYEQSLGVSPVDHWPSASQIKALTGEKPVFPYLTIYNHAMHHCHTRHPPVLPFDIKKPFIGEPSRVLALGNLQLPEQEEMSAAHFDKSEVLQIEKFLADAPGAKHTVYVGYGHLICKSTNFMAGLILRSLMASNTQAIVYAGSGIGLAAIEQEADFSALKAFCEINVLFVKNPPVVRFLSRCLCCLHEGSNAMLSLASMYSLVSIMTPIAGAHFANAAEAAKASQGVALPAMAKMTVAQLSKVLSDFKGNHWKQQHELWSRWEVHANDDELAAGRLSREIQRIFKELVSTEYLIKDMQELKADEGNGPCRCCAYKRVHVA
ncbi:unnamed protein product [Effrenium voratum]|nr:unnamed protein product [Effrenium voratum]